MGLVNGQWELKGNDGAGAGRGIDFATAAYIFEAIAKIQKTVSVGAARKVESSAVIADANLQLVVGYADTEFDFSGAGVPDTVVKSFLDREKEMMAHFAGNDLLGE